MRAYQRFIWVQYRCAVHVGVLRFNMSFLVSRVTDCDSYSRSETRVTSHERVTIHDVVASEAYIEIVLVLPSALFLLNLAIAVTLLLVFSTTLLE